MSDLRLLNGEQFIFGETDEVAAVWGDGDRILWPKGEPLFIVAPSGVGKTTLAQQLILRRIGLPLPDLLGLPVEPCGDRLVLYLAADRPRQIARSFRRMVNPVQGEYVKTALSVHHGPLPFLIDQKPDALLQLCQEQGAGTLVIDSLKDVCGNLADPDVGGHVNRALQLVLAAGIEVLVLHHQRKAQADNRKPRSLSDVYGSTWLTAGAGSVLLLWGDPGDLIVELTHLKQPLADVGPLTLQHDHDRGITTLQGQVDLLELCCESNGVTARDAAAAVYGKPHPERNDVEKVRRRLEQLRKRGDVDRIEPMGAGEATIYYGVREPREGCVTPSREGSRDPHGPARTGSRTLTQPTSHPLRGGVGHTVSPFDNDLSPAEINVLASVAGALPDAAWELAA